MTRLGRRRGGAARAMPYYDTDLFCNTCGARVLKATGMCAFQTSGWCCTRCGHIRWTETHRSPLLTAMWEAVEELATEPS